MKPGDNVRLIEDTAGMTAGSEGTLIGWYAKEVRPVHAQEARIALVRFWDGGPIRVPATAIVRTARFAV